MKTIGLLGGTSWPSTIEYYRYINSQINLRLGKFHSAKILLKSIDYNQIKQFYNENFDKVPNLLKSEFIELANLNPDCILICNNTLHKAYDEFANDLKINIPVFHIVHCAAKKAQEMKYSKVLLLGTQFTMEDRYYKYELEKFGLEVEIPIKEDRVKIQEIQTQLSLGIIEPDQKKNMKAILNNYNNYDAFILACTELPIIIDSEISPRPYIDTIKAQCDYAIEFSLNET